jgi:phosphonate transport system permease protein
VGRRGAILLLLVAAGLASAAALGLGPAGLVPRGGGAEIAREFAAAALRPALRHEADWLPRGASPFPLRLLDAAWRTVAYAAWWVGETGKPSGIGPLVQVAARTLVALLRSVHELLWAVVLLAAMGPAPAAGVVALAVPYSGVLAKVFAEMLDEAPSEAADALRGAGAAPVSVFLFGRLPRALPDMAAYAFYRLECAVRSAAVLGFFGLPTLGYHLKLSFDAMRYREVWSYLYALFAIVVLLEVWSSAVRRRFVA